MHNTIACRSFGETCAHARDCRNSFLEHLIIGLTFFSPQAPNPVQTAIALSETPPPCSCGAAASLSIRSTAQGRFSVGMFGAVRKNGSCFAREQFRSGTVGVPDWNLQGPCVSEGLADVYGAVEHDAVVCVLRCNISSRDCQGTVTG